VVNERTRMKLKQYTEEIMLFSCVFPTSTSIEALKRMIAADTNSAYNAEELENPERVITGFAYVTLIHLALFGDQPKTPDGFVSLCEEPGFDRALIDLMFDAHERVTNQIMPDALGDAMEIRTENLRLQFCHYVVGVYNKQHLFEKELMKFPKDVGLVGGIPMVPGLPLNAAHAMLSAATGGRFTVSFRQANQYLKVNDTVIAAYVAEGYGAEKTQVFLVTGSDRITGLVPPLVVVLDNVTFADELLSYQQSRLITSEVVAYIITLYNIAIKCLKDGTVESLSIGQVLADHPNAIEMKALYEFENSDDTTSPLSEVLASLPTANTNKGYILTPSEFAPRNSAIVFDCCCGFSSGLKCGVRA